MGCGPGFYERNEIVQYLRYVALLTTVGSPKYSPQLIWLDMYMENMKTLHVQEQREAAHRLFALVNEHLYQFGDERVHVYLNLEAQSRGELGFIHGWEQAKKAAGMVDFYAVRQGVTMDITFQNTLQGTGIPSLEEIESFWERSGVNNGAVAIGRDACDCAPPVTQSDFERAVLVQKTVKGPKRVFWWSAGRPDDLQLLLSNGIDAIYTYEPRKLRELIESSPNNQCVRLAVWGESPWVDIVPLPGCLAPTIPSLYMPVPTLQYADVSYASLPY
jgi:hypothetical protein